jgi:hypothetical protein
MGVEPKYASPPIQTTTTNITESSELGDVMKFMNEDLVEADKSMSTIDVKTRLGFLEISSILAVDTLVSLNFLPIQLINFTRMKKRLNISFLGRGREESVQIVVGKREQDLKKGGMMGMMSPK